MMASCRRQRGEREILELATGERSGLRPDICNMAGNCGNMAGNKGSCQIWNYQIFFNKQRHAKSISFTFFVYLFLYSSRCYYCLCSPLNYECLVVGFFLFFFCKKKKNSTRRKMQQKHLVVLNRYLELVGLYEICQSKNHS